VDKRRTWLTQAGVTPAKLMLIGVLAVVLVGVLCVQFGGTGADDAAGLLPPSRRPVVAQRAAAPGESPPVTPAVSAAHQLADYAHWQPPALASVVRHDPFALPASFPRPQFSELESGLANDGTAAPDQGAARAALETQRQQFQTQLEQLRRQGVRVIIKRDKQYVAMIGDQEIHVGDQISGFTVTAIDANGVRVARDLSK